MGDALFLSRKKKIAHLRAAWGKPIEKFRNFDLIAAYHRMVARSDSELSVDEKTWSDLDFDAIFTRMDRNTSGIGQQFLYHLLRTYERDEATLKHRFSLASRVKEDGNLRESIQLAVEGLSGISSYFIAYLVLNKDLPHTKFYPLFYLCPALSIVSLLLIPVNGAFLLAAIAMAITNIILNKIFSHRIYEYFAGFAGLNRLISAALAISAIGSDGTVHEIETLKRYQGMLKSLQKKLGYFVIDKHSLPEMAALGIEYLNMFLLFDIVAYYRSAATLLAHQEEMHDVFKAVGGLDAATAIASYWEEVPIYVPPEFQSKGIGFADLYHPLIPDAVPNSIPMLSGSALITGSNMAGKTTFMKTVGVNMILAQTVSFCLARSITMPTLIVKSSIRRSEDLVEGKSYFFAEIESLQEFLRLGETPNRYLFLIDEIFRGTNTVERLASSTAVLHDLDAANMVLVTTHDIELQELLAGRYKMFHFSEQIEDGRFFFDYRIQEGPCSSGNAITLLEIMNYPASVITQARAVVNELVAGGSVRERSGPVSAYQFKPQNADS